ncbi:MIZ zinc finger domain protein [Aspergillus undulatus]|uniref:MIZ zinc finger domain protein n=1 Tax=Aspergillus undulatus TaxID=1810928 RepID=UPI003CCE249F
MTSHLPNNVSNTPPRRNSRLGALGVELTSSNSTANLFLGAARRSWMSTGTEILNQPQHSRNQNPSIQTLVSSSSTPSAARPPPPPSPRADSPAVARPTSSASTPPNSTSFRPNQSPVTSSAPAAPWNVGPHRPQISPTSNTPPSLTRSPASYSQALPTTAEAQLYQQKQQLQAHLEQQSASSLPSPDPTIPPRSRTSPISAIERYGPPIASPPTTAFPSPPLQQVPTNTLNQPRPNASMVGPFPVSQSLPNNQQGKPQSAHRENARAAPYTLDVQSNSSHILPSSAHARVTSYRETNGAFQVLPTDDSGPVLTREFFKRAKYTVDHCIARTVQLTPMSEAVEIPRLHLLGYACQERDLVYLALHQVYCLSSLREADLRGDDIRFTDKHLQGLEVVRNLLVDNSRASEGFLSWCVNFPQPMSELLKDHFYQQALDGVRRLLACFVDCWIGFENTVKMKNHPPLVEDMVRSLNVVSVVLQYNIFLCLCRRIPSARVEGQLQEIFIQDLDYFKRSLIVSIPAVQRARENEEIVRRYHRVLSAMQGNGGGSYGISPPVKGVAGSSQSISAPGPATIASNAQNSARYVPPYVQPRSGVQGMNGVVPAAIRSPVTVPSSSPRDPTSTVSTQRRGAELQASSLPVTGNIPSPVVQAAPQLMTRPGMSPGQFAQQPQQLVSQSAGPIQHPGHMAHMLAGRRGPHPNPQYATIQQPQHQQRRVTSFLPPAGLPPVINTRPDPNRSAIHQANLRDPVNHFFISEGGEKQQSELLPLLTSFAVGPQVLRQPNRSFKWRLTLSEKEMKNCASYEEEETGKRMLRTVVNGNQIYRLRCIKVQQSILELGEHSWCVAETTWPTAIYMQVNGNDLRPRRKMHNTRDLPLDITPYLQKDTNYIQIGFILGQAEQKDFTYAMALEIITFCTLAIGKSLAQSLPAAESQKRICGRLTRKPDDEDDELSIVSDDLKINLVDPYTARLFNVPVRGAHCEHTECFDHETFLQTRVLKFGTQSAVEADWRCPICRQDARPQKLVVDEFLANVRRELGRTNRCEGARSLVIKADGSWNVKHDEDCPSSEQPSSPAAKRKPSILENEVAQRPKLDSSRSTADAAPNQSSSVVILD